MHGNSPLICRYPINLDYDYSALNGFFSYSINNVGDPFIQATYGMHTREFEVSSRVQPLAVTA